MSAGHARALLKLADPADQVRVSRQALDEGWSVRETERRVGEVEIPDGVVPPDGVEPIVKPGPATKVPLDPQVQRVEEAIRKHLGTEVHLQHSDKGGRIEIRYFSNEELERLLELMGVEVY